MPYAGSAYQSTRLSLPSDSLPRWMSDPKRQTWWSSAPMSTPGRDAHPGSIIRLARLARGETQLQAGRACGFSQSEISRIENGKAHAYDIRLLARLARHLDIPPHMLGLAPAAVEGAEPPVNRRQFVSGAAAALVGVTVPGVFGGAYRDGERLDVGFTSALLRLRWLDDADNAPEPNLALFGKGVTRAKANYQACRYVETAAELPRLLAGLDTATSTFSGDDRRTAEALAADAYHVAASLQLKLGNEGPAWMAADASMRAARRSGDPVTVACSARILTHALMDAHRHRDAVTVARHSAERLAASWNHPDDEALSVYGSLLLRGAIAAARQGDGSISAELLAEAEHAGRRLGADRNLRWTAFGPTNVQLHQVNVAAILGNAGVALRRAQAVDFDRIPIVERKAAFLIDVAGAYLQWGKHEQAYHALLGAERVAPQELSRRPAVRQLVHDTWAGSPPSLSRQVEQLASRIGLAA
jgi:transcriptional regulator with XRE-family HTH domain